MDDTDAVSAAAAMRRSVLGEGHVDGVASSDPSTVDFQKWVTSAAWGVWARGGPLSVRDRSLP